MSEALAAAELPVLPSKTDPPRATAGSIDRPRLGRLLDTSPARCILVAAPAGYGKTTLVRQWAERRPGQVAWVTSDRSDSDPVSFARAVVQALDPIVPLDRARAGLAQRSPSLPEVVPVLCRALRQTPVAYMLVLDDAHELGAPETTQLVEQLLDSTPDGSRIVLAGRSAPPLRVTRRHLAGDLVEVGAPDLAFTVEEAAEVLGRRWGRQVDRQAMVDLHARAEGWPAGLQLAALAVEGQPDPDAAMRALAAGDGDLASYIEQELLRGVSDEERRFLLQTSILDRLDGPLCDAVTTTPGGAAHLSRLVRSGNLFVVPLATSGSYRYHHLFGELLLDGLRRSDPQVEPVLRRRAACHLLDEGDAEGAVRQAIETGDLDFAADVVYRLLFKVIDRGDVGALERWLAGFPPAEVRRRGTLLVAQAWSAASRGRRDDVADLLALLDHADDLGPLPDGTLSLDVAAAALRVVVGSGGVRAMAASAQVVIDAGPAGSPWWGFAHMQHAVAVHLAGADEDPVALFDQAERASRGDGAIHAITLAHCGLVRLQRDDEGGYALIDRAVAELAESGAIDQPLAAMVTTALAYAEAKRGRPDASSAAAARTHESIRIVGRTIPRAVAHHRLVLADAALLRGDVASAAEELARSQDVLGFEPEARRLHDWADRVGQLASARQRAARDGRWVQLSAAEVRVLEQLRTHRSLEEIGTHLYVSRNTVKSHTISIYRKLGVSGRSAAIERAVDLGLLSG